MSTPSDPLQAQTHVQELGVCPFVTNSSRLTEDGQSVVASGHRILNLRTAEDITRLQYSEAEVQSAVEEAIEVHLRTAKPRIVLEYRFLPDDQRASQIRFMRSVLLQYDPLTFLDGKFGGYNFLLNRYQKLKSRRPNFPWRLYGFSKLDKAQRQALVPGLLRYESFAHLVEKHPDGSATVVAYFENPDFLQLVVAFVYHAFAPDISPDLIPEEHTLIRELVRNLPVGIFVCVLCMVNEVLVRMNANDIPEALSPVSPPVKFSDTKNMQTYMHWYNHFYNVVPVHPQYAALNTRLNKLIASARIALVVEITDIQINEEVL